MIHETFKFNRPGLQLEESVKLTMERNGIKVGDFCRGKSEMFIASFKCEVVKIYCNSAMVKIINCYNKDDQKEAQYLENIAIIRLRDLKPIKGAMTK
ncbi:MAG: hypothetical protein L0K62_00100 [Lactobacillus sp.]|nr:hypothetical protein [Lactobacillus sp.]MDN6663162.1 hypothetical protein [Tetragenococcus koreensis]